MSRWPPSWRPGFWSACFDLLFALAIFGYGLSRIDRLARPGSAAPLRWAFQTGGGAGLDSQHLSAWFY